MATDTAGDIINKAFKKAGIDTPNATHDADGLDALNNLLTSWSIDGLMVPFVIRENFTLTIGDAEYSIGSGADFDTVRPLKVIDAFLRDSSIDYSLDVGALKGYNRVSMKTSECRPTKLYYLAEMANGKILFDREPDKAYELYLDSEKEITEFAATTTTVADIFVPNPYKRGLIYNLAVDLVSDIDSNLSGAKLNRLYQIAEETKEALVNYHASVRGVKEVDYDYGITHYLRK